MRFFDLKGKTIVSVIAYDCEGDVKPPPYKGATELRFLDSDGIKYLMYHEQDCCESVLVDDVAGDFQDIIGCPIIEAEETSNHNVSDKYKFDSQTWTFYKLSTIKGSVTIRWHGNSNGYYSESVDFCIVR